MNVASPNTESIPHLCHSAVLSSLPSVSHHSLFSSYAIVLNYCFMIKNTKTLDFYHSNDINIYHDEHNNRTHDMSGLVSDGFGEEFSLLDVVYSREVEFLLNKV